MNDTPPEGPPTPEELQRRTEALFDRIIRIGHMTFGEMAHPPRPNWAVAPAPPVGPGALPAASAPQAILIKNMPEQLDLDQARARLPFALCLPAWVPEGFARTDEIAVTGGGFGTSVVEGEGEPSELPANVHFPVSVHMSWLHPDGRGIRLGITQLPDDRPEFASRGITPVPPGAVREVTVHGAPAALLERQFYHALPQDQTGTSDEAELIWEQGELMYSLGVFRWAGAGDMLVTIAESIAPDG